MDMMNNTQTASTQRKPRTLQRVKARREYLYGYSLRKWIAGEIARKWEDPPPILSAEFRQFHHSLVLEAEAQVFPYGNFFPATVDDSKMIHPFIAFATSPKLHHLPKAPRQDKIEKLRTILGTDEPPQWAERWC
jgi:hypothetical protein